MFYFNISSVPSSNISIKKLNLINTIETTILFYNFCFFFFLNIFYFHQQNIKKSIVSVALEI